MADLPPSDLGRPNGGETARCRRCGADGKLGGHCPQCGGFLLLNKDAEIHGLSRRPLQGPTPPIDLALVDRLTAAVLASKGGDDASPVLRAQIPDFAFAVTVRDTAAARLAAVGPWTRAGRKRPVADIYLALSKQAQSLAQQIGLGSVPKAVETVQDIIREHDRRHEAEAVHAQELTREGDTHD